MDLKKYWQLIVGRRYLFIAVSLLCLSAIVWGSYFIPKMYEAQCTVLIERNVINNLVKDIAITPSLDERIRVMSYTMTSRNLLMKVLRELDLDVDRGKTGAVEEIIQNFQEKTVIKMVNKGAKAGTADWFSVTYRDRSPKVARDYINTLVRRYIEENVSAKRDESFEANKFLSEQREYFKSKLDAVDGKIMDFRRESDIYISIDEKTIVGEIKGAQENLEAIRTQKMELEARRSATEKQIHEEKPYAVAFTGKKGDSLISLQNKLNELLLKYTENYPEVIRLKAEIEMLKRQMLERPQDAGPDQEAETEMMTLNPFRLKLKEEIAKIDAEVAALSAKERRLTSSIEAKKKYLRDIPIDKKNLSDLERERETYKNIDNELVFRLGQSEVSKQMEIQDKTETFRIIDPAILPTEPVSPNRVLIILMGIVAGIAAGLGAVFLLDNIDNSVKTVDELKTFFTAPVLAVIPQIVTEEEAARNDRMDRKIYAFSIAYLSIIGIVLIKEAIARFF